MIAARVGRDDRRAGGRGPSRRRLRIRGALPALSPSRRRLCARHGARRRSSRGPGPGRVLLRAAQDARNGRADRIQALDLRDSAQRRDRPLAAYGSCGGSLSRRAGAAAPLRPEPARRGAASGDRGDRQGAPRPPAGRPRRAPRGADPGPRDARAGGHVLPRDRRAPRPQPVVGRDGALSRAPPARGRVHGHLRGAPLRVDAGRHDASGRGHRRRARRGAPGTPRAPLPLLQAPGPRAGSEAARRPGPVVAQDGRPAAPAVPLERGREPGGRRRGSGRHRRSGWRRARRRGRWRRHGCDRWRPPSERQAGPRRASDRSHPAGPRASDVPARVPAGASRSAPRPRRIATTAVAMGAWRRRRKHPASCPRGASRRPRRAPSRRRCRSCRTFARPFRRTHPRGPPTFRLCRACRRRRRSRRWRYSVEVPVEAGTVVDAVTGALDLSGSG